MDKDGLRYGFRYDPMEWATNDKSLEAAMVRLDLLQKPAEGDPETIRVAAATLYAKLEEDLDLCDPPARSHDLIHVACKHGLADGETFGKLILDNCKRDDDGACGIYEAIALCRVGLSRDPAVCKAVERSAKSVMKDNAFHTCPWGMFLKLQVLWLGRESAEVQDALNKLMTIVANNKNDVGCFYDKDPMARFSVVGILDHPLAEGIATGALPMILGGQRADGGWGDRSYQVFRTLTRYGLLESLRVLDTRPPDWDVVKTIPAPAGDLFTMTWDGERLWVCSPKAQELIAVSPEDGTVLKRFKLKEEKLGGIGWYDGALAVTQRNPKRLLRVDPESGDVSVLRGLDEADDLGGVAQVGGKLVVCDLFMPCAWEYASITEGGGTYRCLGGPQGLAVQDETVWRFDWMAPLLIRSDIDGKIFEHGGLPFGREIQGIAYDGKNLWVLDNKEQRICMIQKVQ